MPEVLRVNAGQSTDVLERLGLEPQKYFLLSAHREENMDIEENFLSLMEAVNTIAEDYKLPIIYSLHPRSEKLIKNRNFLFNPLVRKMTPFGFNDYIALQKFSFCVLSDSDTLAEESSILGFPAVSLRTSTERPEAIDKGSFILGGIGASSVMQAVKLATKLKNVKTPDVPDYLDDNVSVKVVKIIQGYTGIVNDRVWRKTK